MYLLTHLPEKTIKKGPLVENDSIEQIEFLFLASFGEFMHA